MERNHPFAARRATRRIAAAGKAKKQSPKHPRTATTSVHRNRLADTTHPLERAGDFCTIPLAELELSPTCTIRMSRNEMLELRARDNETSTCKSSPIAYPSFGLINGRPLEFAPIIGAPISVVAACSSGLPMHAIFTLAAVGLGTGLGITLGFHRLFTHRSFATIRPLEWILMVLGCMAGQSAPFWWIATHRIHHQHSDEDGDPHSPHIWDGTRLGLWRGFWHSHFGWLQANGYGYPVNVVTDLMRRPDLVFIDRTWFLWYLLGLVLPAAFGYLVGGTAHDFLMGFLIGGLFRHFITLQITFAVNSVTHFWGTQPFATGDGSRNNFIVGLLALGEGWHNNHHAFPYSARHGFHWYQPDFTWMVIRTLEWMGLAWRVKLPRAPIKLTETLE
jgi:stearoyl-CoA desaturase (delta-9 desaturase)